MNVATFDRAVEGLVRLANRDDGLNGQVGDNHRFAEAVADLAIDAQAMRCLGYRGFAKAKAGDIPPEHIILKLFTSEAQRRACYTAFDALGALGLDLEGPGPNKRTEWDIEHYGPPPVDASLVNPFGDGTWIVQYLRAFSGTIAGGTSEIQRNIVAERVLGLPRDPPAARPSTTARPPVGTGRPATRHPGTGAQADRPVPEPSVGDRSVR
jgi:alkylation response protein AidB-like acyl-CoA dehydrogenase